MHDPDALHPQHTCATPEERERQRREYRAMHARWLARQAPIAERDRRWRRRAQVAAGTLCLVALAGVFLLGHQVIAWLHGEESQWLAERVSGLSLGTITTTLAGLRMFFAWRRRQRGPAVMRAVDATSSILPGTR
jgi:hypothetical protein